MTHRTLRAALPAAAVAAAFLASTGASPARTADPVDAEISVVAAPPAAAPNHHYPSNRAPLAVSPLVKLPPGAVRPGGWLLSQLQLMRDGFTGRLSEVSKFLGEDSGWITGKGKGWEELPYWLKGYGDLAYLLRDPAMIAATKRWIDLALASQQPDGFFGPADNRAKGDLWPNMIMLAALQSWHEWSGDPRVPAVMTKYFRYEMSLPDERLLPASWQKLRGGENLESIYWLHARTGDAFLLDLARRVYARTADWRSPILTPERDRDWEESSFYHGVNIAMGFRYPGAYYPQAKDPALLEAVERNYRQVLDAYGRQPGGLFGADENIRPGRDDVRQGAETCTMVEFMASFESLLRVTGDPLWAERCEEIAFNSLPASMTPDLKGLHYLTAPNMISCDASLDHDFQNKETLLSYDPYAYRCCQHNVAFGWPWFAETLWTATADDGLAAVMYAPSEVSAKVGDGSVVQVCEQTRYPFDGSLEFTVSTERPVAFPLYLRVPGWAPSARLEINGAAADAPARSGRLLAIRRTWRHGDRVRVEFPQAVEAVTWPGRGGAVSVRRGPLWYSLKIGERRNRCGGTDAWPALEILPTTPWNYGLVLDPARPAASVSVAVEREPAYQPFTPDAAPVTLTAKARRVPAWTAQRRMAGLLPAGPVAGAPELEDVTLVPMGCARLRVAVFPRLDE